MRNIFDSAKIKEAIESSNYKSVLQRWKEHFFLAEYSKGELITSPLLDKSLITIVVNGTLRIYLIREDGECYSLSHGHADYILGDMELFSCPPLKNIYTEAETDLLCLCLPLDSLRTELMQDAAFLSVIGKSLSEKMNAVTTLNAEPSTLTERVLSVMKFKCTDGVLKGLEKNAFQLHCSARQLQRIMNELENQSVVSKIGKGTYKLNIEE